jgi:RNA polymerase sigma-70 factor (ECF subfamily)
LAYAGAIVRDDHLAEDIFQEVAVIAMRKREEIRDAAHFLGWMRQTARHRALKALRAMHRSPTMEESLLDLMDEQWAEHDATPSGELMEALRRCLEELSPYARSLVRLRYVEGLSGGRLAEAVGRELNTVYVALSRTHRALADCIRRRVAT